jgi:uncharacterized damage-inducible protein DinB
MSVIDTMIGVWKFNRDRTLGTLDEIAGLADSSAALGWRPGDGRAHIAWQLMHIGITEELFATERMKGESPKWPDLVSRFKGGSTPDDNIPDVGQVRELLDQSRSHLIEAASQLSEADLQTIPEAFKERGWTLGTMLQVVAWHECHHQGQAHITLNLLKASQA